jgi:hypothetical protein
LDNDLIRSVRVKKNWTHIQHVSYNYYTSVENYNTLNYKAICAS